MTNAAFVRSVIPIPDPSEITSREIARLRADLMVTFETGLSSAVSTADAKRDGTHASIMAAAQQADGRLTALAELTHERFEGLKIAFREDKIAAATAVAAAFAAQEKLAIAQNLSNTAAITKSEGSTTKELESLDGKIVSLKETMATDVRNLEGRLNRGEGGATGARDMRTEHRADMGQILMACGLAISLLLGIANLVHFPSASTPNGPALPVTVR